MDHGVSPEFFPAFADLFTNRTRAARRNGLFVRTINPDQF